MALGRWCGGEKAARVRSRDGVCRAEPQLIGGRTRARFSIPEFRKQVDSSILEVGDARRAGGRA